MPIYKFKKYDQHLALRFDGIVETRVSKDIHIYIALVAVVPWQVAALKSNAPSWAVTTDVHNYDSN